MSISGTLSLLLLVFIAQSDANVIQPTFTCWFNTGNTQRNIILGYTTTVSSTEPSSNMITPLSYNGSQPSLYDTKGVNYAITLALTSNSVTWQIDSLRVNVSLSDLTEATRCINTVFSSQCPTSITGFCDDGSYCNGNEICFPDVMGGSTGACHYTTEVINCASGLVCNETVRACVSPVTLPPPTTAPPTMAPTTMVPTNAPTRAPTTQPPTNWPTHIPVSTPSPANRDVIIAEEPPKPPVEDVIISEEHVCQDDGDCVSVANFCKGAYVCNQLTSLCVPVNLYYDPCSNYRTTLREYYSSTNATLFPVSITCAEAPKLCVESFTCQTNMDCSDNLVCNGMELCVSGQCYYQSDQSLAAVCHTELAVTCAEPDGCSLVDTLVQFNTSSPTYNHTRHHNGISPTILGLVVGAVVIVGLIILGCTLYFEFNAVDEPVIASGYKSVFDRRLPLGAKLRSQLGYGKSRND